MLNNSRTESNSSRSGFRPFEGLKKVIDKVDNALDKVGDKIEKTVDKVGDKIKDGVQDVGKAVQKAVLPVDRFFDGLNIKNPFEGKKVIDIGRDVLNKVIKTRPDEEGRAYLEKTQDFRQTTTLAKSLQDQLAKLPPNDPRAAKIQQALKTAEDHLKTSTGYTLDTAPKPGSVWVSPKLMDGRDITLNTKNFPTKAPVTAPPAPLDLMFPGGKGSITMAGPDGTPRQVKSPEEYKALVAQNRATSGMERKDGDPIGVHLSLEGGGGKGKRYGAMLGELARQGVVPTSLSGSSAGAIGAALVAAGADSAALDRFVKDPALGKLYDIDWKVGDGGVLQGQKAYDLIDKTLRELTGIKDRPVTFADLKVPLNIVAAKMSDSAPAKGQEDMTQLKNRLFVFNQENTPDTPVALAVRASMAIPAAFDPVRMVDPTTGREVTLVDGGLFDNLPMGYKQHGLPVIGATLASRGDNHPAAHTGQPQALPGGTINVTNTLLNGLNALDLQKKAAGGSNDFRDRTNPPDGNFMISVPSWDLRDPSRNNTVLGFPYDSKLDPVLDQQSKQVTQNFLRQYLGKLGTPGAKGTNTPATIPANLRFDATVQHNGQNWKAAYTGGDNVAFTNEKGQTYQLPIGKQKIEAMYLDNLAYSDLNDQLAFHLRNSMRGLPAPGMKAGA